MTFFKVLEGAKSIAIGGHVRPDGDCVGSCMGMYLYLKEVYPEKEVDIYLQNIPDALKVLNKMDEIREEIPEDKVYDLFICQDCGDKERLEFSVPLFESAKHTFCIDHHISNKGFAEHNYVVPEASSTSELVYNLLEEEKISDEVAKALYLGIVHDTGVFQYSCAAPSTKGLYTVTASPAVFMYRHTWVLLSSSTYTAKPTWSTRFRAPMEST